MNFYPFNSIYSHCHPSLAFSQFFQSFSGYFRYLSLPIPFHTLPAVFRHNQLFPPISKICHLFSDIVCPFHPFNPPIAIFQMFPVICLPFSSISSIFLVISSNFQLFQQFLLLQFLAISCHVQVIPAMSSQMQD